MEVLVFMIQTNINININLNKLKRKLFLKGVMTFCYGDEIQESAEN